MGFRLVRGPKVRCGSIFLIKKFTFWPLVLQCCHHCLTQFHALPPHFIQNQAPIHRLSHQLYAHWPHSLQAYIKCFKKLLLLWLTIVFWLISTSPPQCTESERVLSLHPAAIQFSLKLFSSFPRQQKEGLLNEGGVSETIRDKGLVLGYRLCEVTDCVK